MATQIGATLGAIGGCVPTATDLAIAPPNGENQGVNQVDAAAEILRRQRAAQQDVKMLSTMARAPSSCERRKGRASRGVV